MSNEQPLNRLQRDPNANFRAVGIYVPKVTGACFERYGFHAAEIILNWTAIVGERMAAYTMPVRLRWPKAPDRLGDSAAAPARRPQKSALEVLVDAGRAHEIPYQKRTILDRINVYFGYPAVTDLRPIDGRLPKPEPSPAKPSPTPAQKVAAERAVAGIADEELRAALARLGAHVGHAADAKILPASSG